MFFMPETYYVSGAMQRGKFASLLLHGVIPIARRQPRPVAARIVQSVWLTKYCLRNPVAATLFFALVGLLGLVAFARMGRSMLPPVAIPIVSIAAPYPGAAPAEVERLIVEPIEETLQSVPDVSRVSASAQNGFAQIVVRFRFGSRIEADRAGVQQAVDAARANLPADLVAPVVSNDDPTQAPILEEGVSSALLSDGELSEILARRIAPAVRMASGVGRVVVGGAQTRQFTIRPRSAALGALKVTPLDVFRGVAAGNDVLPGGTLRSPTAEAAIGIDAAAISPDRLEALPVTVPGAPATRLHDVADVVDGYADRDSISRVDGDSSAILSVSAATGADALRTIAAVRRVFARLRARLPSVRFEELRTDEPPTRATIGGVLQTLGEGVALTVLVMLLFLHAWRKAAVAAVAIPSSLCAAFVAMWAFGFTLNLLTLMGLSLTIGILVDDSIVIIEAVARNAGRGRSGDEAALAGRRELGGAAFAITLVDVAVFAPIALMPGIIGEFMREFGLAVVFATAFSLLVSLTLTPLLCARWALPNGSPLFDAMPYAAVVRALSARARTLPWTFRKGPLLHSIAAWHGAINTFGAAESRVAQRYAEVWLPWAWRRRLVVSAAVIGACAASFAVLLFGLIPTEFSPPVNRGKVTVDLKLLAGTPLAATDAAASRLTQALLRDPAIAHVEATAGRAFNGSADVLASNVAELGIVLTDPNGNGTRVTREVKALAGLAPDATIAATGQGMGGAAPISYSISSDAADSSGVDAGAARIADVLSRSPFATDVRTSDLGVAPYVAIGIDEEKARLLNVNSDDAAQTARIATAGAIAAKARLPSGLIDVLVRSDAAEQGSLDEIARQPIRSGDGTMIPLGDVSRITRSQQPVVLEREDGRRVVTVSANPVAGAPIGPVTAAVSRALSAPGFLPTGARIEPRGDVEQFLDAVVRIFAALGISLGLVYAILAVLYRSYALPLIVMVTVPLAAVGAFGTLFVLNALREIWPAAGVLQNQTLNLYSMLGIVMLVGLVAKNGILLIEYSERAFRRGRSALDAVCQAALVRFRPIVMTTFAMIAGMLPLALGDTIGAEYRRALGTVVIGGLTTSLLLTLFVVPIVYVAYRGAADSATLRSGWQRATRRREERSRAAC